MSIIVLDAGHAGRGIDPGAVGPNGTLESDVVFDIMNKLGNMLQADGYGVVYTRQSYADPQSDDLSNRVEIANNSCADIFISGHCNAAANSAAQGTETYSFTNGSANSAKLANLCQQELVSELGTIDRGTKTANYMVLKYTNMPAILVEFAFISNAAEEALLCDDAYKTRCAKALYKGVYRYFNE